MSFTVLEAISSLRRYTMFCRQMGVDYTEAMRHLFGLFLLSVLCSPGSFAQHSGASASLPENQKPVLTVEGRGSQIYACQQSGKTYQWTFIAPAARLFDSTGNEVGSHGIGPVWNYQDSSSIQGTVVAQQPSPEAGSVPWLLLKGANPRNNGLLSTVEYIRRSETHGGTAPATGCDASHTGELLRVPYTATYTFYSSK